MDNARIAAVLTWVYAAGFGLSTIPVAAFLLRHGRLPVFAHVRSGCYAPTDLLSPLVVPV